ncbi:energy transducer TonB [Spiribacter vilamensis]|uniref:Protein TonB n=1 Tax=Spiribacter vilamensis TaxID=531306 RepID=A0A4Q8D1H8_9GAMM|nr:energy transducer TonB [Spiribacter vilamensis]RZU99209.1 protein TonB [Spiribacter vilamensis]TVO61803.1 TonB family protein [Spiribacter vilamensis]
MEDAALVRDRLLMAIFVSALVHLIVIFGPVGPAGLSVPRIETREPLEVTVQPASTTRQPSLRLVTGAARESWPTPSASSPRQRAVDGTTEDAPTARYLRDWIVHTETLGNREYPRELIEAGITGRVVVAITLTADGEVVDTRILGGSDHPALQDAARSLVQSAAPYPAVPPEVLQGNDELIVTRTWSFGEGER